MGIDLNETVMLRKTEQVIGLGIVAAALVALYGLWCLVSGEATLPGRGRLVITGTPLFTYATAAIALGLALHFCFFWGNHKKLALYHQPLQVLALAVAVVLYVGTLLLVVLR